ncbi:MAG: AMP-binding protein [Gammaproteobacteria bacterium]|nr:AMP-binding protein [Gammaproteobacteria bacterium]MBU1644707.1 AMP-binding protein [Gammaproteobacteria bacterium]MBU1973521.1 AMP-binding protein [Gammaproteobacteria bacterium]
MNLALSARPGLPGLRFPALPASDVLPRFALFQQLEASQWLAPDKLREWQLLQLDTLIRHVWAAVPGYRPRLKAAGLAPGSPLSPQTWSRLALLTRRDLQLHGPDFVSQAMPPEHGTTSPARTSGSSGEPVEVLRSGLDRLMWEAITLRDHAWHRRDLAGTFCAIRAVRADASPDTPSRNWGSATMGLFDTGPCFVFPINADVSAQVEWLQRHDPHYLLTYPSNLRALLRQIEPDSLSRLREVRTIGETLPRGLRESVRDQLGVPLVDLYSCSEVGNVALQCPDTDQYHVQSESLLVEVLDEAGQPCAPGEVGRVVVTTLHSFAQPLLRYDLRDYAEVGIPCSCGRGLPTLRRIAGRVRNMLTMPNGEKRWPVIGSGELDYRRIAPLRQFQLAQTTRDVIELRVVAERPFTPDDEAALTNLMRSRLGEEFEIRLVHCDELPPGANGKFEEFLSMIEE